MPAKLMLVVIDAMKPAQFEQALEQGRAPALQAIRDRGSYTGAAIAPFPSVTPVCAATIATGTAPDRHDIPGMNWYRRAEERYIEYGTSFKASQAFGFRRSLTDTIYNMNAEHLADDVETVFESLDDAGVRTAGTTYLMYRGRHRHDVAASETALTRLASTVFSRPVLGPKELFYADIFASRKTGCRSQLGLPGVRDQHSGCVGVHLVENDLFDFLLLSLPDNDTHSHRRGPDTQVDSIAMADAEIQRVMDAGGGAEAFLDEHAVIVCSDHAQSPVEAEIDLFRAFDGFEIMPPAGPRGLRDGPAELALCPSSRAAQVYVLDRDRRDELTRRAERVLLSLDGIDLTMRMTTHPDGEAAVRGDAGEVRFAPRGELLDGEGRQWSVEGDLALLDLDTADGRVRSATYPDALGRIWAALRSPASGEVLASARPGHEFLDWGRSSHGGGGSHGALHAEDSNAVLLWCGTGPESADVKEQWTLRDVAAMVRLHFGV